MNVQEFSNRFDIQYNNISSNSAPNIDEYEKSVYLTRAQMQLIKDYFNPLGNKYRKGFENTTKRRNDLEKLVKHYNSGGVSSTNRVDNISEDSKFFHLPENVFLIVQEQAYSLDPKLTCKTTELSNSEYFYNTTEFIKKVKKESKVLKVRPTTHDEFNIQKDNPFKKPDKNTVWRIGYNTMGSIELVSEYDLKMYSIRYIEFPSPIVLVNLGVVFPGEGLTIDGVSLPQTSSLDATMHYEIIDRAVELAKLDYDAGNLGPRVQINTRNE